jgi:hypothetical protein
MCRARHAALKMLSIFQTATVASSQVPLGHISNSSGSDDHCDVYPGNETNGKYCVHSLEYCLMPFVDSFPDDANTGYDAALANTTPPAANPANPTDTADPADTTDPVDAADADLLEVLTNDVIGTSLEQDCSILPPSPTPQGSIAPEAAPTQHSQQDSNHSDARPPLAIIHLPHGSPGAPVPGAPQGASPYHSRQELFGANRWAPFQSQCDWEIAHWAKMRGPSASAMEELLAIPEVCAGCISAIVSLTRAEAYYKTWPVIQLYKKAESYY